MAKDRDSMVALVAGAAHEDWRKQWVEQNGNKPRVKKTKDEAWIAAHGGTNEVDIAATAYADLPSDWPGREQARRRGRGGRRHRGHAVGPQPRRHLHRGGRRCRPLQVGRAQRELVRCHPQGAVRRAARGREGEGPRVRAAGYRGLSDGVDVRRGV